MGISSDTDRTGLAQADDARHVQRPGTHAALVPATINNGGNLHSRILAPYVQSADSLGPIHLVRGNRHYIDVLLGHIDGNLSYGLRRVGVEDHAALATNLSDLGDRLQHADLVIGRHDRNQDGLVVHRRASSSSRSTSPSFCTGI